MFAPALPETLRVSRPDFPLLSAVTVVDSEVFAFYNPSA